MIEVPSGACEANAEIPRRDLVEVERKSGSFGVKLANGFKGLAALRNLEFPVAHVVGVQPGQGEHQTTSAEWLREFELNVLLFAWLWAGKGEQSFWITIKELRGIGLRPGETRAY